MGGKASRERAQAMAFPETTRTDLQALALLAMQGEKGSGQQPRPETRPKKRRKKPKRKNKE